MSKFKKNFILIILIVVSLIPLLDLLAPGLPVTHDGQDQVARIANFYRNLEEGNIIPRWASYLNWGFGHPILIFLYPLPSYAASIFHVLGFNLVDSVKLVFAIAYVLSGLAFYMWLKIFLSREAALIGSTLYIVAPYRFVDLYVRGAIGEHVAFLFIPLVLYFILKISKSYSKFYILGGAFSLAGLILSHNAISLMFIPIILVYSIYLYRKTRVNFLKNLILTFILGFGVSSFFWIPAFFEGKYTLRDIVTMGEYRTRFVELKDLIYGSWNYGGTAQFTKQIGVVQWFMAIALIPFSFYQYKLKNKLWIFSLGLISVLIISIFLMVPESTFIWEKIKTLQKFQFPWRILSISVLVTSVMGALVIEQFKNYRKLLIAIFLILILFLNKDYWKAQNYKVYSESFFNGIYNGTTDTGESSPIWSVRFMEKRPKAHLEVIDGKARIDELKRSSTGHEYAIFVLTKSRFRENTLYFPGWSVLVNGEKIQTEFQDSKNRGLMTFYLDPGKYNLVVKFEETKLRLIADYLSLASIVSLIFYFKLKRI